MTNSLKELQDERAALLKEREKYVAYPPRNLTNKIGRLTQRINKIKKKETPITMGMNVHERIKMIRERIDEITKDLTSPSLTVRRQRELERSLRQLNFTLDYNLKVKNVILRG